MFEGRGTHSMSSWQRVGVRFTQRKPTGYAHSRHETPLEMELTTARFRRGNFFCGKEKSTVFSPAQQRSWWLNFWVKIFSCGRNSGCFQHHNSMKYVLYAVHGWRVMQYLRQKTSFNENRIFCSRGFLLCVCIASHNIKQYLFYSLRNNGSMLLTYNYNCFCS